MTSPRTCHPRQRSSPPSAHHTRLFKPVPNILQHIRHSINKRLSNILKKLLHILAKKLRDDLHSLLPKANNRVPDQTDPSGNASPNLIKHSLERVFDRYPRRYQPCCDFVREGFECVTYNVRNLGYVFAETDKAAGDLGDG